MSTDGLKLQMDGIEELTQRLEKLGTRVALRGPSAAVRAGGSVIVKEMRSRAPKETGSLKKSIGQKVKQYRRNQTVTAIIGARSKRYETVLGKRNPAYYAHLVELGVKPHRLGRRGGTHPGIVRRPFMRPAWDGAAPRARQAVIDKMVQVFKKEAAAVGG